MTNHLNTKGCEIDDLQFGSMVAELCHCTDLDIEEFQNRSLSFLLMAIGREKKALTRQHLPGNGILTTKVDKLVLNSVVYDVCRELVNLKKTHIESFDGKTVLSLIKHCHKVLCPRLSSPKKLTRRESRYRFATELIKRRRRNGDL